MANLKLKNDSYEEIEYSGVSFVKIPNNKGGLSVFTNVDDSDATSDDILDGKKAYTTQGQVVGGIPTKTAEDLTIELAKGSVTDHKIIITPTATVASNAYYSASSITGEPVTVESSELVSGDLEITTAEDISKDVADYASVSIIIPTEEKTTTPTTSQQTIAPSSNTLLSKVTVEAIQTETKTVTPTTSQQTITPSSGKYISSVTIEAVPIGELGTVSATKSSVSNNQITVTPKIGAGTAGYNDMLAKSGQAVTVGASELVDGSKTITGNATYDITNYKSVIVNVPTEAKPEETFNVTPTTSVQTITPTSGKVFSGGTVQAIQTETKSVTPTTSQQTITPTSGKFISQVTVGAIQTETKSVTPTTSEQTITPTSGKFISQVTVSAMPIGVLGTVSATKGSVSNHSITVTPKISAGTAGYNEMQAKSGEGVTVSVNELVSGSETKTANGTYDVTSLASLIVAIPEYDGSVNLISFS